MPITLSKGVATPHYTPTGFVTQLRPTAQADTEADYEFSLPSVTATPQQNLNIAPYINATQNKAGRYGAAAYAAGLSPMIMSVIAPAIPPALTTAFKYTTPSTYLGAGAYSTPMGASGASLVGALADTGLASYYGAEAADKFRKELPEASTSKNLYNATNAGLGALPLVGLPQRLGSNLRRFMRYRGLESQFLQRYKGRDLSEEISSLNRRIREFKDEEIKIDKLKNALVHYSHRKSDPGSNKFILSNELNPETVPHPRLFPISSTSRKTEIPISFQNESSKLSIISSTSEVHPNLDDFSIVNGKIQTPSTVNVITSVNPFSRIEGDDQAVRQKITQYVDNLNAHMGEDGAVAGSLVHHRNGLIKGTSNGVSVVGPQDTEIYTTEARFPALAKKLEFQQATTNSVGGRKGTSPFTFRNNDSSHQGVDTEINIIQATKDGKATGSVAHQIYRALFPEQYSKFSYDLAMSGHEEDLFDTPLPISAEELLQLVRNSANMQKHLLSDLVGMETFTRPQNIKANTRLYNILFNDSPEVSAQLHDALQTVGKANMGSQYKLGTELYPNLSFEDVEANKQFLQDVFNLSPEEATKFASREDVMRNAVDIYNHSYSTGVRHVNPQVLRNGANPKIELFTGNGQFGGGNASGLGLNTALLNPEGGHSLGNDKLIAVNQFSLTNKPEEIKSVSDLTNQIRRLQDPVNFSTQPSENVIILSREHSPHTYRKDLMQQISDIANEQNTPIQLNMGEHQYGFGYAGGLTPPISSGLRRSTRTGPELGSLLPSLAKLKNQRIVAIPIPREWETPIGEYISQAQQKLDVDRKLWQTSSMGEKSKLLQKYGVAFPIKHRKSFPGSTILFNKVDELQEPLFKLKFAYAGGTESQKSKAMTEYYKQYKQQRKRLYELKQQVAKNSKIKKDLYKQVNELQLKDNLRYKLLRGKERAVQDLKYDLLETNIYGAAGLAGWGLAKAISEGKKKKEKIAREWIENHPILPDPMSYGNQSSQNTSN